MHGEGRLIQQFIYLGFCGLFFAWLAHGLDSQGVTSRAIEWGNDACDFKDWMPDCFQAKALEGACEKFCFDQA